MKIISIISEKGGVGKTTLAIHLAGAAIAAGLSALALDADPQTTASQWNHWRAGAEPEVVDCAFPTLLPRKVQQGADLVVIDTPPHADIMAREACKIADLILIPCRPRRSTCRRWRRRPSWSARPASPSLSCSPAGPSGCPPPIATRVS